MAEGQFPLLPCQDLLDCLCRYHVRLDAASTRQTKLLFCTTGILLRRLASDAQLSAVSHVIVDEVRWSHSSSAHCLRRLFNSLRAASMQQQISPCLGNTYNMHSWLTLVKQCLPTPASKRVFKVSGDRCRCTRGRCRATSSWRSSGTSSQPAELLAAL